MHLAQLNIGKAKAPMDAPEMKEFADNLDPINAIAESSPGFIWRLKDDSGNATGIQAFDEPDILVNMSVWESDEALKHFMLKTHHVDFLKRRREWFVRPLEATTVLWWIPEGHIPTLEEAIERLTHLRKHGESPHAFSFKSRFQPADVLATAQP